MNSSDKPKPDVDKKTAKGAGEGGFAPHPDTPGPPEHFDPHSYGKPSKGDDAKPPEGQQQARTTAGIFRSEGDRARKR